MALADELQIAYKQRPLRTIALTTLWAFLALSAVAVCSSLVKDANETSARERRREAFNQLNAVVGAVRDWPAVELPALGGARATLRTVCRGYTELSSGDFQVQLRVEASAEVRRQFGGVLSGLGRFTIRFSDQDGFKVREVPIQWSQLSQVRDSRGSVTALDWAGGGGPCWSEVASYASWNLEVFFPPSLPHE